VAPVSTSGAVINSGASVTPEFVPERNAGTVTVGFCLIDGGDSVRHGHGICEIGPGDDCYRRWCAPCELNGD
jgi:hypothetical protein